MRQSRYRTKYSKLASRSIDLLARSNDSKTREAQSLEERPPLRIDRYRGRRYEEGGERGGGTRVGDVDSHRVPLRGPWQFRDTVTATDAWHRTATPSQRYVFYQRPWSAITSATACWMSRTRNDGSLPSSFVVDLVPFPQQWPLCARDGCYSNAARDEKGREERRVIHVGVDKALPFSA